MVRGGGNFSRGDQKEEPARKNKRKREGYVYTCINFFFKREGSQKREREIVRLV